MTARKPGALPISIFGYHSRKAFKLRAPWLMPTESTVSLKNLNFIKRFHNTYHFKAHEKEIMRADQSNLKFKIK